MNTHKTPGYRKAVTDLQTFLRVISDPSLVPDGIYGKQTENAVREFQKGHNIACTGKVDCETWKAIVEEYENTVSAQDDPVPVSPFSAPLLDGCLKSGDICDTVFTVRMMLCTLKLEYDCFEKIEPGNVFDTELEKAITDFQIIHGVEPTGIIDKNTWNHLANEYNRCIKRNH